MFGIETRDDEVRRCSDQGTHTSHARSIAQRDEQLGGGDIKFLRPHLDDIHEEGHDGGIAEERT